MTEFIFTVPFPHRDTQSPGRNRLGQRTVPACYPGRTPDTAIRITGEALDTHSNSILAGSGRLIDPGAPLLKVPYRIPQRTHTKILIFELPTVTRVSAVTHHVVLGSNSGQCLLGLAAVRAVRLGEHDQRLRRH